MPHIILLNGTSSSGKSTLAKALQNRLRSPYLHVGIDAFEEMMPKSLSPTDDPQWQGVFARTLSGFHRSLRALAEAENNLIVDHVLVEDEPPLSWIPECLTELQRFPVHLVGVRCSPEELERRERRRGDRPAGLALWQLSRMHRRMLYDIEVETSIATPEECASAVLAGVADAPRAFTLTLAGYRNEIV